MVLERHEIMSVPEYPSIPIPNQSQIQYMQSQENEESNNASEGEIEFPLGLKLRKTRSFLELIESTLKEAIKEKRISNFAAQPVADKLKASNFPASHLQIGSWQRKSIHQGDLVAKLYYAKRKLVWEVLHGGLKRKIEIQWSDISAIKAQIIDDEREILEIELNQPPSFYLETDPQPRKHTIWQQSGDFTGGQALNCRRHTVIFPPATLGKHYEKLLQYDQRLSDLSKKPFPSHNHPYFHHNSFQFSPFTTGFNDYHLELPHDQHNCHVQNYSAQPILPHEFPHIQKAHPHFNVTNQSSPTTAAEVPFIGDGGCSYPYENQWNNQGISHHLQGHANHNYYHNFGAKLSKMDINTPNNELDYIENHVLEDFRPNYSDEMAMFNRVSPMHQLLDLQQKEANTIHHYPPPVQWSPPSPTPDNVMNINPFMTTSSNPHLLPDSMMDDFADKVPRQNAQLWK